MASEKNKVSVGGDNARLIVLGSYFGIARHNGSFICLPTFGQKNQTRLQSWLQGVRNSPRV